MVRKILLVPFCVLSLVLTACAAPRSAQLVEVQKEIPNVVLEIRYATTNNFTGKILYPSAKCCLRRSTAEKLAKAQKEFNALGFGLKIFDGYRPLSVQKKMWEVYPHEGYVANPKKGSRHNRGAAVDCTLVNLTNHVELAMPSGYDDFTLKANRDYAGGAPDTIRNRDLLERVMVKNGFDGLPTEWWHFDDVQWKQFDLLDIDCSTIDTAHQN